MLTLKEWKELTSKEKGKRYNELSNHDKFIVRQGEYFDLDIEIDEDTEFMQELKEAWKYVEKHKKEIDKTLK